MKDILTWSAEDLQTASTANFSMLIFMIRIGITWPVKTNGNEN